MKNRFFGKSWIVLMALVCAVLVICLAGCGRAKSISLAEFADYSLNGYDGYGTLKDRFDLDRLAEVVAGAAGYSEKKSDYEDKLELVREDLEDLLTGKWSKTDHIAVGDLLTCRWDVAKNALKEKYNVTFDTTGYTHTVSAEELKALKELNAEDLLEVSVFGYNGAGTVSVSNGNSDLKEITVKLPSDFDEDMVSNGDLIEITLSVKNGTDLKEYLGMNGYQAPADGFVTWKVEGLEEPREMDPFDYLIVNYDGPSGIGTPVLEFAESPEFDDVLNAIVIVPDKWSNLSLGDEISCTVSYKDVNEKNPIDVVEYCLRRFGVRLTATDKTYKVDEIDRYITAYDELPDDLLKEMRARADEVNDWVRSETITPVKTEYLGSRFYFATEYMERHDQNDLYFLYRITVNIRKEKYSLSAVEYYYEEKVFYNYVLYSDILLQKDGTLTVDLDAYSISQLRLGMNSEFYLYGFQTMEELLDDAGPGWWSNYYELETEELLTD